jgi:hypothetical protein
MYYFENWMGMTYFSMRLRHFPQLVEEQHYLRPSLEVTSIWRQNYDVNSMGVYRSIFTGVYLYCYIGVLYYLFIYLLLLFDNMSILFYYESICFIKFLQDIFVSLIQLIWTCIALCMYRLKFKFYTPFVFILRIKFLAIKLF